MGNFFLRNPESLALESGIRLKESGIPPTTGSRNLSVTDKKIWNREPGIWNPQCEIQNPRLSWITLHGTYEKEVWQECLATDKSTVK